MKKTLIREPSTANLKLFLNLFQGRDGVFARQWGDGQGYSPVRPERSINADDIALHIRGAETYGIYPIKKDNTVELVCCKCQVLFPVVSMQSNYVILSAK